MCDPGWVGAEMEQGETCFAMDEKQFLYAINQASQRPHFRKVPASAQRLESPFQPPPGKNVHERLVKRSQQTPEALRDPSTRNTPSDRAQNVDKEFRLFFDSLLDRIFQCGSQSRRKFIATF